MWLLQSLPKILLSVVLWLLQLLSPTRRIVSCSVEKDSKKPQKMRTCASCPQISYFWLNTLMFTHVHLVLVRRRTMKMNHLQKKMCNMPPAWWDFCSSACIGDTRRCSFIGSEILYSWKVVWFPMEMKTFCVSWHPIIHKKQHMSHPPRPASTIYFTFLLHKRLP